MRRYLLSSLLAIGLFVVALRGGSYDEVARGEAFFVVWWLLGLSVAFGFLPRSTLPPAGWVAVVSLVALVAWTALGALWSDSVARTLHEATRTLGYFGVLLLVAWTFGQTGWRRGVVALTVTATAICAVALVSRLVPGLASELEQTGYDTRRLNYPFNYWNAVGVWAAMTVGLALAWSAHAARWWWRAFALGGVAVAVPVVYVTYSRSASVGVVVAVVTVIALSRNRWLAALHTLVVAATSAAVIASIRANPAIADATGFRGSGAVAVALAGSLAACAVVGYLGSVTGVDRVRLTPRAARAVVAVAGTVVVLAAVAVGPALARDAWDSFQQRQDVVTTGDPAARLTDLSGERRNLWSAALDAFTGQPMKGVGAGTYEFLWNMDHRWSHHVRDAHSLYLEAMAELGLPGAVLLVIALGAVLVAAARVAIRAVDPGSAGAAAGCAAAFITFCVAAGVDWMWESTAVATAAVIAGGLALAADSRAAPALKTLPRVAAGLATIVALALQVPALLAASEVSASQAAVRERRTDDAVFAASIALHAEPWNTAGYLQRALVLERQGFLDAAAKDANEAISKERVNADNWLILARIEVERGDAKAAIAAANTARKLNPNNPAFAAP